MIANRMATLRPRRGKDSDDRILSAFDLPAHTETFLPAVEDQRGSEFPTERRASGCSPFTSVAVIRNTVRTYGAQVRDWARDALAASS